MRALFTKHNVTTILAIICVGAVALFFLLLSFRGISQHNRLHAWMDAVKAPGGVVPLEEVEATDIAWQTWMLERRPLCPMCRQAIHLVFTNAVGKKILFYGTNRTVRPGHFYAYCPTRDNQGRRLFQFGNTTYLLSDDYIDWTNACLVQGKSCDIKRGSMFRILLTAHVTSCRPYLWVGERIPGHTDVLREERSD